jgi:hypothetical protein
MRCSSTGPSLNKSFTTRAVIACGAALFACWACAETGASREMHGQVRFLETGAPVPAAVLAIDELRVPASPLLLPPRRELFRFTASADGSFSVRLPKGKYLMLRLLDQPCQWRGVGMRLDTVDFNEPVVIRAVQWACAPK